MGTCYQEVVTEEDETTRKRSEVVTIKSESSKIYIDEIRPESDHFED